MTRSSLPLFMLAALSLSACDTGTSHDVAPGSPVDESRSGSDAAASAPAAARRTAARLDDTGLLPPVDEVEGRWSEQANGDIAFGSGAGEPAFSLRCAGDSAEVILFLPGPLAEGEDRRGTLVTQGGSATGFFHSTGSGEALMQMRLPAGHPVFGQIIEGGRFAVSTEEAEPLLLPHSDTVSTRLQQCRS